MLGYFQCLSSAYSQVCLSGGGREQDGGRDEEGEDPHYTNGVHTVIRENGSTLYVRFPHRANTNHFRCNLLAGEF